MTNEEAYKLGKAEAYEDAARIADGMSKKVEGERPSRTFARWGEGYRDASERIASAIRDRSGSAYSSGGDKPGVSYKEKPVLEIENAKLREALEKADNRNRVLDEKIYQENAKLQAEAKRLNAKLEHLVDARNVWGELKWHDAFMDSQKERCRLNVEVHKLREALERIANYPMKENDIIPDAMSDIARAALQGDE